MVAQIDEQHAAMVADAVAPAGQPDGLADVGLAQVSAMMRAIAVHVRWLSTIGGTGCLSENGRRESANGRRAPAPLVFALEPPFHADAVPDDLRERRAILV